MRAAALAGSRRVTGAGGIVLVPAAADDKSAAAARSRALYDCGRVGVSASRSPLHVPVDAVTGTGIGPEVHRGGTTVQAGVVARSVVRTKALTRPGFTS